MGPQNGNKCESVGPGRAAGELQPQFGRDRDVLVQERPSQEMLDDAVPDLGVLRLQDPVVLVREVEEPVLGLPETGWGRRVLDGHDGTNLPIRPLRGVSLRPFMANGVTRPQNSSGLAQKHPGPRAHGHGTARGTG